MESHEQQESSNKNWMKIDMNRGWVLRQLKYLQFFKCSPKKSVFFFVLQSTKSFFTPNKFISREFSFCRLYVDENSDRFAARSWDYRNNGVISWEKSARDGFNVAAENKLTAHRSQNGSVPCANVNLWHYEHET